MHKADGTQRSSFVLGVHWKVAALVASQQSGRQHLQLETPGFVPLPTARSVQRRINFFQLGQSLNFVLPAVGWGHEYGWEKINLGVAVANQSNVADAVIMVK